MAARPLFPRVVPSSIAAPHGLLARLLENPGREVHQLISRLLAGLNHPELWLLVAAVLLLTAAVAALRVFRQRELAAGGRLIQLHAPPTVDPAGALTFWNNLAALLRPGWKRAVAGQPHLGFEIGADAGGLDFRIWVPDAVPPGLVEQAAEAAWPGARTTTRPAAPPLTDTAAATGGRLRLARPAALPLATDHPADPLRPLLGALSGLEENQAACIQLLTRPVTGRRLAQLRTAAKRRRASGHTAAGQLAPAPDPFRASELAGMVTKAASPCYAAELRYTVATVTPSADRSTAKLEAAVRRGQAHAIASAFAGYTGLNHFTRRPLRKPIKQLTGRRLGRGQLLSVAEVAALAHLPLDATVPGLSRAGARSVSAAAAIPTLQAAPNTKIDAYFADGPEWGQDSISFPSGPMTSTDGKPDRPDRPRGIDSSSFPSGPMTSTDANLPPEPVRPPVDAGKLLGLTGRGRRVMLPVADGRHHFHVLGATGSGKSTLLTNMVLDDIAAGRGVAVIDPKGDLITDLLARIPMAAAGRIALLDPARNADGRPSTIALNPLAGTDPQLAVDHLTGIFRRIFAAFWGPRTDDLMRSGCLTLLTHAARTRQPTSLLELPQLLTDPVFRARITTGLGDPGGLGSFWNTYEQLGDAGRSQLIGPLLNKLRAFLLRDFVRNTVTASAASGHLPAADVLAGGILLARLPKGLLGDDTSRLLGSFLVAQIWQTATHQSQFGQTNRPDASLYVDECHNFLTLPRSFDEVLAEARGYHLSLVLAHQHLGQLPAELRGALSANARNKIYFPVSPEDAQVLERHTLPELTAYDLAHSTGFTAAARLVVDGNNTPAFTLRTRPAPAAIPGRADALRAALDGRLPAAPDRRPTTISGHPPEEASPATPGIQSGIQSGIRSGIQSGIRLSSDPHPAAERAAPEPDRPSDGQADLTGEWS